MIYFLFLNNQKSIVGIISDRCVYNGQKYVYYLVNPYVIERNIPLSRDHFLAGSLKYEKYMLYVFLI